MDEYEYEVEPLFQSSFQDFSRAGRSFGLGARSMGDRFSQAQRFVHRSTMTPVERFLEDVQRFCYENAIPYDEPTYERIARKHLRPYYLSPKACVLAAAKIVTHDGRIMRDKFHDRTVVELCEQHDLKPVDLYRYAVIISETADRE
jgi:hypothetical protein